MTPINVGWVLSDLVSEWLEIASNDLTVAHHLFDTMHPKPLEIICYHCQQANVCTSLIQSLHVAQQE